MMTKNNYNDDDDEDIDFSQLESSQGNSKTKNLNTLNFKELNINDKLKTQANSSSSKNNSTQILKNYKENHKNPGYSQRHLKKVEIESKIQSTSKNSRKENTHNSLNREIPNNRNYNKDLSADNSVSVKYQDTVNTDYSPKNMKLMDALNNIDRDLFVKITKKEKMEENIPIQKSILRERQKSSLSCLSDFVAESIKNRNESEKSLIKNENELFIENEQKNQGNLITSKIANRKEKEFSQINSNNLKVLHTIDVIPDIKINRVEIGEELQNSPNTKNNYINNESIGNNKIENEFFDNSKDNFYVKRKKRDSISTSVQGRENNTLTKKTNQIKNSQKNILLDISDSAISHTNSNKILGEMDVSIKKTEQNFNVEKNFTTINNFKKQFYENLLNLNDSIHNKSFQIKDESNIQAYEACKVAYEMLENNLNELSEIKKNFEILSDEKRDLNSVNTDLKSNIKELEKKLGKFEKENLILKNEYLKLLKEKNSLINRIQEDYDDIGLLAGDFTKKYKELNDI